MNDTIGIDISKDRLDAYWLSRRGYRQFCNDKAGVKALSLWAREAGTARVIFESTGVYHRLVETGLAQHGVSFARVRACCGRWDACIQRVVRGSVCAVNAFGPPTECD